MNGLLLNNLGNLHRLKSLVGIRPAGYAMGRAYETHMGPCHPDRFKVRSLYGMMATTSANGYDMNRKPSLLPGNISPLRIALCVGGAILVVVQFVRSAHMDPLVAMPGDVMFHIVMMALGAILFVLGMWGPSM